MGQASGKTLNVQTAWTSWLPVVIGPTLAIVALIAIWSNIRIDTPVAALLAFGAAVAVSPSISKFRFGKDGLEFETSLTATATTIENALKAHDTAIANLNENVSKLSKIVDELKQKLVAGAASAPSGEGALVEIGQLVAPLSGALMGVTRSLEANTGLIATGSDIIGALGSQIADLRAKIQS